MPTNKSEQQRMINPISLISEFRFTSMKKIFAFSLILCCSYFGNAQTHFTDTKTLLPLLCKPWKIDYTIMDGVKYNGETDSSLINSSFQFFPDNTFIFFMDDQQLFGHWNFYAEDQSLLIDFSTDHLFDENFALLSLNEAHLSYTASYYQVGKKTWEVHLSPGETN